jgi:hypothetical protein
MPGPSGKEGCTNSAAIDLLVASCGAGGSSSDRDELTPAARVADPAQARGVAVARGGPAADGEQVSAAANSTAGSRANEDLESAESLAVSPD